MCRGTAYHVADCHRMDVDTQRTSSPGSSAESRASARRGLPRTALIWLAEVLTSRTTDPRPDYPRTPSTAFEDPASTRLGQFFGLAADQHPGLSGFSLLSQGREAFIARLALTDLAERGLDMQYYVWDGDTTGRIIVEHVMKAADRGVRVRLLVDDPFYKDSDSVKAGLDAHPNVEIRLFNPLTNRRWSILDFIFDFGRVNRRMHNKLMVADNAAAIVGGRNIGDIYYGVNTFANYRDLDVLAAGPVVRDLSGVFDRYWNSPSTVPIAAIVDRAHDAADLDAIRIRLREAIAAADYPYPIDQELEQLAAQGAELRDNLVWAHGRIVADDPESIAPGKESDDVIEFIRGRVAQLKEELLVESPYFVLPARAQATVKVLQERNVRVRVLTNSLFERHAAGAFRLCQDPKAAAREWHGAIRTAPGYRCLPAGLVNPFGAVASASHSLARAKLWSRMIEASEANAMASLRSGSRALYHQPCSCASSRVSCEGAAARGASKNP
jgi:phosphatidylserine/phosphatidylglycerophosphate/cardiolipin synthase-like enzyme